MWIERVILIYKNFYYNKYINISWSIPNMNFIFGSSLKFYKVLGPVLGGTHV